jgi:hypothetical protein
LERSILLCLTTESPRGLKKARFWQKNKQVFEETICNRRPKKTYCCFVDVQKAYDRVWRDGLWEKLAQYGMNGKMWRVLKSIYERVESSVLVEDGQTRFFSVDVGLRQGCLLSPILFALYINDLAQEIKKENLGAKLVMHKDGRISILMFADDIVLASEDKRKLEKLMDTMYQYSLKWRFSFNYEKCAVVVFDASTKNREIKLGNSMHLRLSLEIWSKTNQTRAILQISRSRIRCET